MTQEEKHSRLIAQISEIREVLSHAATPDVVWRCRRIMLQHPREVEKSTGLKSPYRQTQYLFGLLLTTPEPTAAEPLRETEWKRLFALLEAVARSYANEQLPPREEIESAPETFQRRYAVALPAFIQHFHTGILAQPDQILDRARAYLAPFDDDLTAAVGLSGTQAISIAEWIAARVPEQFEEAVGRHGIWKALHEPFRRGEKSFEQTIAEMKQLHAKGELPPPPEDPLAIRLGHLTHHFGEFAAAAFWRVFVSRRGSASFTYFDDPNPADLAPLLAVSDEIALCPTANPLYLAVLQRLSQVLMDGPWRTAFLRQRDVVLEEQAARVLGKLFNGGAEFYRSAYESPAAHHEHDLVVFWNGHLLIIEAKASPPVTPFRDPDRAFVRIQRAFRGDGGIQKAYGQAAHLMRRLTQGEALRLYDRKGRLLRTAEPETLNGVHAICVTADDFGVLAVDLSLLLEKDAELPYPWAVNIHSLEAFVEVLQRKGWGPAEFVRYLEQRRELHGHISNRDELEVAGMFIRHGELPSPAAHPDAYFLIDPAYSQIFDDVYMAGQGGPEPDLSTRPGPVMTDLREALLADLPPRQERPVIVPDRLSGANRNRPCPCGSGKKWKKCCGRA